jgi:hypothetical protein
VGLSLLLRWQAWILAELGDHCLGDLCLMIFWIAFRIFRITFWVVGIQLFFLRRVLVLLDGGYAKSWSTGLAYQLLLRDLYIVFVKICVALRT